MKNINTKRNRLIVFGVVVIVMVYFMATSLGKMAFAGVGVADTIKPDESFAVINIHGTIQGSSKALDRSGYDHNATINYIDELIADETNKGIFLDIDSPGGTVYHSDEMYLKLMEYKTKTNRPIAAYFGSMAASGGYYIGCAADSITANRNCWTGSIGVIISTTNLKGLYDKLGIKEVLITSGANKGMGSAGSDLTEEQRAIYQSLVDESYENFTSIVSSARKMDIQKVKQLADGRVYTAQQALANGLIDEINQREDALLAFEEKTGAQRYEKSLYIPSFLDSLLAKVQTIAPKSDMQALADQLNFEQIGVPLYYYGLN